MASALFSTYLVPSLPFRRRQSSSASSGLSLSPPTSNDSAFLSGASSHLRCAKCLADLALSSQIVSKGFTGRHGRAYLVAPSTSSSTTTTTTLPNLPNTSSSRPVPRQLVTGAHTVSDIHCTHCGICLGWKYVAAEEESQRYKVGKFILETKRVTRNATWEMDGEDHAEWSAVAADSAERRRSSVVPIQMPPPKGALVREYPQEEVEFDSQDEEECEELFLGTWNPETTARRRRRRRLQE